jgi:AcrR family transcriptional regulator
MAHKKLINPIKSPTQERSRFTVEQIVEAAAQVFAERGYAGATTNHIAERAGVSIGSVYQYFPNKEAILVTLAKRHVEMAGNMLMGLVAGRNLLETDLTELLRLFIQATLELHTGNPRLNYVILSEAVWSAEAMEQVHELEDQFIDQLALSLNTHRQVSVKNSRHAAYILVHMIKNLAHEFVIHPPGGMSEKAFVEEMVGLAAGYLMYRPK